MAQRGYFISFEGIDRSGKSTQAALLAESLGERALLVREPGGTVLSERVREILKDPGIELSPRAEALLFAAARADLVETVIEPELAAGRVVIADRYIDSSLAYQGVVRGLGIDAIAELNDWASGGLLPDRTFLISIDPQRAATRGVEVGDRFEDEGLSFQQAVAAAYEELAAAAAERIVKVDGDREPDAVAADVARLAGELIGTVAA
ncbi:MAG: dTMP kinase [Solirubrobacterales bacterium]